MRLAALFAVLSVCGAAIAAAPPGTVSKEKKIDAKMDAAELQGTWKVTDTRGFKSDKVANELKDLRLTVKDDHMTVRYGDKTADATFRLDATTTPRHIDVTVTDGPADAKGKTFPGIYLLEGKALHIAFRGSGEKRPSEFITRNQEGLYEVWLKKAEK